MVEKLELYQQIEYHKELQLRQRDSYSQNITNEALLKNNLVIEMDYKSKIVMGNLINFSKNVNYKSQNQVVKFNILWQLCYERKHFIDVCFCEKSFKK